MKTDNEIRIEGMNVLFKYMDIVDAEKFVSLLQRDRFDYTKWRQKLYEGLSVKELSAKAMQFRKMNSSILEG